MEDSGEKDVIRETYYDFNGEKVTGEEGFVTRLRVMIGNQTIAVTWRDENDNPVPYGDDTYYQVVYTYDKDNINREKYFDTDGFAIMLEDGAVSHRYEYDDDGNLIKTTKYDYGDHEVE